MEVKRRQNDAFDRRSCSTKSRRKEEREAVNFGQRQEEQTRFDYQNTEKGYQEKPKVGVHHVEKERKLRKVNVNLSLKDRGPKEKHHNRHLGVMIEKQERRETVLTATFDKYLNTGGSPNEKQSFLARRESETLSWTDKLTIPKTKFCTGERLRGTLLDTK
jgi:hypothetical protein